MKTTGCTMVNRNQLGDVMHEKPKGSS